MSLTKAMWDYHGINVADVTPCSCSSDRLFAAPVRQVSGEYKIDCANCGKATRAQPDVRTSLAAWDKIATK